MSIDNTAQLTLFSLILMRMSGFVLMNPILGRNNIPVRVKAGFIFILTMTIYSASMEEAICGRLCSRLCHALVFFYC